MPNDNIKRRPGGMEPGTPPLSEDLGFYSIPEVDIPMPLDTLIKVGMLADVEGHGDRIPIAGISIALCPRRDAAAEGLKAVDIAEATAVEVHKIEAALLPYAVFGLGEKFEAGWAYGREIRRVYEAGE